jgi:hypothetical protein
VKLLKQRLTIVVAVLALALLGAGSALAFDCIRVSSSLDGLKQSTLSGKWLLFDFSSGPALQQTLAEIGVEVSSEDAQCASEAYSESGQPLYFALGIGVAGGENEHAAAGGVLAHNNPNESVLGNGKGIDHLDDSEIFSALEEAAVSCGVPVEEE